MSLTLLITAADESFTMPMPEPAILERLLDRCGRDADDVFGFEEKDVGDDGTPTRVLPSDRVASAAQTLLDRLSDDPELTPRMFRFEVPMPSGPPVTCKATCPFKLPKDEHWYNLESYNGDDCILVKWDGRSGAKPFPGTKVDVRHLHHIDTESLGTIRILSKRKRTPLLNDLKRINEFAMRHCGIEVVRQLV